MNRRRRMSPLFLLALMPLVLAARQADAARDPVASLVETTEPDGDDADTTEPGQDVEIDPARREWLEFTEEADPDTFAGGAELEDLVDGNRVIMIGDSIMASTSSRYGGEMCEELVPDGWQIEVDAETGRFIDFGDRVLDQRLDDEFVAAVIMLGNNYGANPEVYEEYLRDLVERLEPRPIVLSTVTVFQENRADVNDAIYEIAQDHDNIRVLDWATETAVNPALVGGDGLHLTDLGRARFADMVAEELGDAPSRDEGDCLRSSFTDDSAGTGETGPIPGQVTMPPNTFPATTPPQTDPIPGTTEPTGTAPQTTFGPGTSVETTVGATEPPTVPPTEPPTVPPTDPPTVPPTAPPTVPPTNPPATTPP